MTCAAAAAAPVGLPLRAPLRLRRCCCQHGSPRQAAPAALPGRLGAWRAWPPALPPRPRRCRCRCCRGCHRATAPRHALPAAHRAPAAAWCQCAGTAARTCRGRPARTGVVGGRCAAERSRCGAECLPHSRRRAGRQLLAPRSAGCPSSTHHWDACLHQRAQLLQARSGLGRRRLVGCGSRVVLGQEAAQLLLRPRLQRTAAAIPTDSAEALSGLALFCGAGRQPRAPAAAAGDPPAALLQELRPQPRALLLLLLPQRREAAVQVAVLGLHLRRGGVAQRRLRRACKHASDQSSLCTLTSKP